MARYKLTPDPSTGRSYLPVTLAGAELLHDSILNKGSAFPEDERDALRLRGLLPPAVSTIEQQLARAYENYCRHEDDLARHIYLVGLHDRNETLFYRMLLEHLEEMLPIVYTPTVGRACQQYSHIYRRSRGLFVTPADVPRMAEVLRNAAPPDVGVIVATDGEGVLGIGDQGAGGMGISIGKLVLYTAAAGIHPSRCLPLCIDVGTANEAIRKDPLYLGLRSDRLRGDRYTALLDALVEGIRHVYPGVLLQWEDFSRQNACTVLDRYRDRLCSFNDDIQGTAAVVIAGVLKYCQVVRRPFTDQRFCVHGAGAAGSGIAATLTRTLCDLGMTRGEARRNVAALDSEGLVLSDRPALPAYKRDAAWD
ncbi:MAG: oxaloacetate-decarboxylating malate dehydrogenase, partial [Acidobacteriota bacterium]